MPNEVDVKNLPDIQKVKIENYPEVTNVNVLNLKDIQGPEVQKVEIVSSPKEILQRVTIDNTEKMASWAPAIIKVFFNGIAKLWANGITVKLDEEERLKPLPVIIVDTRGRPKVDPPAQLVIPGGFGRSGGGGSSGGGDATAANQTSQIALETQMVANLQTINSLTPTVYDYIALSYTNGTLTGVVYKNGGAAGSVVSTLALGYTGSDLTSVTKT